MTNPSQSTAGGTERDLEDALFGPKCKARAQGSVGGNDPADCDWPLCGCDPYADKVIAALEESGLLASPPPRGLAAAEGDDVAVLVALLKRIANKPHFFSCETIARHTAKAADTIDALKAERDRLITAVGEHITVRSEYLAQRDALAEEVKGLRRVLERDRTAVASGIEAIRKAISRRAWLCEGRGSYAYDDERYQAEFGAALDEIGLSLEPLTKIAADWSSCPTDPEEIRRARAATQELKGEVK